MTENNGSFSGNYYLESGNSVCTDKCPKCGNTRCPNFVPRKTLNKFERFAVSFAVGVVCAAVVILSGVFLVKAASSVISSSEPAVPNEFSEFYDLPENAELTVGLGVSVIDLSEYDMQGSGLDGGLLIKYFSERNAFEGTEVELNDVIVGCEGKVINGIADLRPILLNGHEGDKLEIKIARYSDGSPEFFTVTATLVPLETESESESEAD